MTPQQSSLYREIQSLHSWLIGVCGNMPKNVCLDELTRLMTRCLVEAQTACGCAIEEKDNEEKLKFMEVVGVNILNVQSITKTLYDYSVSNTKSTRIISNKQRVQLLDKMHSIESQIGKFSNSIRTRIVKSGVE